MAISLNDALAAVLAAVHVMDAEVLATEDAAGRIVARDVVSAIDLPPFANSAMDGFAVRAADTAMSGRGSVRLPIHGESRAGQPSDEPLHPGSAARISTGATLPEGADAVVRIEDVALADGAIQLTETVQRGTHIRRAGDDIVRGAVVVPAGTLVRAGELAMLAATGHTQVTVHRRPTVAVLTTGDEVVPAGTPLGPGQIHESNSVMLAAQAREAGATPTMVVGGVGDDLAVTIDAIDRALDAADVVVISGGVSKGDHDHVKPALEALGVQRIFWQIALRPGHPTLFGTVERAGRTKLVFGLPGNPVSAYVTFQLLVAEAIARMCGVGRSFLELPAVYSGPTQHKPIGMSLALRCRIDTGPFGVLAMLTSASQRSHIIGSLVAADGIAIVAPARDRVEDGDHVMVRLPT
ncbi:MAG TPA: molybdopterin molybdotransferase MoeA [Miltoncostaeales bacterium]|jgi:molybdopterin molybdotransferase|nr:molybdopterin molybdotransferase MoeA [Miltoncostaeales bacterium]